MKSCDMPFIQNKVGTGIKNGCFTALPFSRMMGMMSLTRCRYEFIPHVILKILEKTGVCFNMFFAA
jgi:hypothetical protein